MSQFGILHPNCINVIKKRVLHYNRTFHKVYQDELARQLGTKGPVIVRYERDEIKPSIEAATKIVRILEVSLDWLVGNTDTELDTATLNRILDINKLSQRDKELVFEFLDSFIANRKIKNVLQQ